MTDTFYCPRGPGPGTSLKPPFNGEAEWDVEPNGDRTCSYCGSLHPDDFLDIMQRFAAGEEGYHFGLTDKTYKVYANRPGVLNASQGGIKFYGHHAVPEEHADRSVHEAAWAAAVDKYRADFQARWGRA